MFFVLLYQDVVRAIEATDVSGSTPKNTVAIKDCGVIPVDEPFNVEE